MILNGLFAVICDSLNAYNHHISNCPCYCSFSFISCIFIMSVFVYAKWQLGLLLFINLQKRVQKSEGEVMNVIPPSDNFKIVLMNIFLQKLTQFMK